MTRRERIMATLRGESVDRPAVSFYELNGAENVDDQDPYNIYSHPSWRPLIELAREKTDRIVMRGVAYRSVTPDPIENISEIETVERGNSRFTTRRVNVNGRVLVSRSRRDRDINTVWTEEHLLKDTDDLRAFLEIPVGGSVADVDPSSVHEVEEQLGDSGIVMIDTPDPLCLAAVLFDMAEYTIIAMMEPELFTRLLDRFASRLLPKTEAVAKALPGRLWRIYGPEYASPPYLPPHFFREYVCRYVTPMIESIHRYGGYARIHSHGNLEAILDDIVSTGADGLDPVEPPPQGDVELSYVRKKYGEQLVLFGNLEVSDIENMPTAGFEEEVKRAIDEGTSGTGRGFVLMPSSCPYGRELSSLTLRNYEKIIELIERL